MKKEFRFASIIYHPETGDICCERCGNAQPDDAILTRYAGSWVCKNCAELCGNTPNAKTVSVAEICAFVER